MTPPLTPEQRANYSMTQPSLRMLTWPRLMKMNPCQEAIPWGREQFDGRRSVSTRDVLNRLIEDNRLMWASWFIVRIMTNRQYVTYAIYASEQVIDLYEKQYPTDLRPRQAIEAAKAYVNTSRLKSKKVAEDATWAVWVATRAAEAIAWADRAATWATWAARAAETAAWADRAAAGTAWAAAEAAEVAARAVRAVAGAAAEDEMRKKILNYGIELLNAPNRPR